MQAFFEQYGPVEHIERGIPVTGDQGVGQLVSARVSFYISICTM